MAKCLHRRLVSPIIRIRQQGMQFVKTDMWINKSINSTGADKDALFHSLAFRSIKQLYAPQKVRFHKSFYILIARFMKSGNDRVVFIHNFSQTQAVSGITIPRYKKSATVIDLFLSKQIGKITNGESLRLELTPRDSRIILIRHS